MGESNGNLARDIKENPKFINEAKKHFQEAILLWDKTNKPAQYKEEIVEKMKKVDKISYINAKEIELEKLKSLKSKILSIFGQAEDDFDDEEYDQSSSNHENKKKFFISQIDAKINSIEQCLRDPQIPEYFNCIFSQCLIDNPFTTVSGSSYSKLPIYSHVRHRGNDPITREDITDRQIYENKALASGIYQFKCEYPFAEDIDLEV